jgi:hypothetical protein
MGWRRLVIVRLAIICITLLLASPCFATNYCVTPTGGASGYTGVDWDHAMKWNSGANQLTFARGTGNVYYLADGDYEGRTLGTAASSTYVITIRKACATGTGDSDHVTDTGWSSSMGDGQATWTGLTTSLYVSTAYWTIDGIFGSGSSASSYGFYATGSASADTTPVRFGSYGDSCSYVQISHFAVVCPGQGSDSYSQYGFSGYGNNVTLSYVYASGCQVSMWTQGNDMTIEHCYLGAFWSTGNHHGVAVEVILRPIVRHNFFSVCNNMCVEPGGGSTTNITEGKFYGNIAIDVGVNGFCKGVSNGEIVDSVFYNNTLVNATGPLLYPSNYGTGSGNILQNNLLYNCSAGLAYDQGGEIATHSYNAFFDSGSPSETGVQVASGNPFVNSAGGNYHLSFATNAGYTLSSPYTTDMDGVTRGGDGTWDRGAYEYGSGSASGSLKGVSITGGAFR